MARPKHDDMYILASAYMFLDDVVAENGINYISEKIIPMEMDELMEVALANATDAKEAMEEAFKDKFGHSNMGERDKHLMLKTIWHGAFIIGLNIASGRTPEQAFGGIDMSRDPLEYSKSERDHILSGMTNGVDKESLDYACDQRVLRINKSFQGGKDIILMAGLFMDGLVGGTLYVTVKENLGEDEMNSMKEVIDGMSTAEELLKSFI